MDIHTITHHLRHFSVLLSFSFTICWTSNTIYTNLQERCSLTIWRMCLIFPYQLKPSCWIPWTCLLTMNLGFHPMHRFLRSCLPCRCTSLIQWAKALNGVPLGRHSVWKIQSHLRKMCFLNTSNVRQSFSPDLWIMFLLLLLLLLTCFFFPHWLVYCLTDSKVTSFQRQLNLYGFRRITKGEDESDVHFLVFFLSRNPHLVS